MEGLLRAARPPPRRPEWSVEDHALFAARRDFELLRLVVSDKKIWTAARRMGLFSHSHSHPPAATASAGARSSVGGAGAAPAAQSGCHLRPPRRPAQRARLGGRDGQSQSQPLQPADAADDATTAVASRDRPAGDASAKADNAKRRRSAARSARRHLQRQRCIRSRMLAVLFALRLRRRARLRRALQDVGELSDASSDGQLAAKRGTSDRPPSSSSSGADDSELLAVVPPPTSSGCQPCHECSTELPEGRRLDVMAMLGCFTEGPLWVCRPCARTSYPDLVEFFPREARGERLKAPAKRGGGWRLGKR